jgi:hypothetical protein
VAKKSSIEANDVSCTITRLFDFIVLGFCFKINRKKHPALGGMPRDCDIDEVLVFFSEELGRAAKAAGAFGREQRSLQRREITSREAQCVVGNVRL